MANRSARSNWEIIIRGIFFYKKITPKSCAVRWRLVPAVFAQSIFGGRTGQERPCSFWSRISKASIKVKFPSANVDSRGNSFHWSTLLGNYNEDNLHALPLFLWWAILRFLDLVDNQHLKTFEDHNKVCRISFSASAPSIFHNIIKISMKSLIPSAIR